ncbi:MAG TPA: hypothetical protein VHP11_15010, partial [Tepidisphaeraceae bacterium]|nr:hypothetical protein [Tepidisphaeraceae bacterium]
MAVAFDEVLDAGDAFLFGFVGQHRAANDVADGVDALRGSGEVFLHGDAPLGIRLDGDGFQAQIVDVGFAAGGDEHFVARN